MKVDCLHGYFKFSELEPGDLSKFMSLYGLELERNGDHFTFADLVDAPFYSIEGSTYLGAPTSVTFAGQPWEVMRENGLVYDFSSGTVKLIETVLRPIEVRNAGYYFLSPGMIVPGSVREDGSRVTDYAAFFLGERLGFKYSEVRYD